jgi:ABC-2 type transport system permease protein
MSQAHFALWVEYRAELYLWVVAGVLPLILMAVWGEVSRSGDFGFNRIQFIRYFLAVFIVRQMTFVWVIWEFEELVVSGKLSMQLLQPINPFWRFLLAHLTERVARFPLVLVIAAACFFLYPEASFVPKPLDAVYCASFLLVSFCVRFLMQYAFSMLTFWSERASAVEDLWFTAHLFLSGLMAPLDVYPESVREVALFTPFPYLIYYPARLLLGEALPLGRAALVLSVWGLGSFLLYRILWRQGLRRYSAMGA